MHTHPNSSNFASIPEAIEDFRNGKFVIVMDDESRENEGDLIMSAELATSEKVAFCINHTTGILCAPMTAARALELQVPIMVRANEDLNCTAFTIAIDSIDTTTGVSAMDRANTFNQLSNINCKASQFRRPGHVFPLIARPGGVLERKGHTEAAIELCKLASVSQVGLIAELVNKDGSMKRLEDCIKFGITNNIKVINIEQLVAYITERGKLLDIPSIPKPNARGITLVSQCNIPIKIQGNNLGIWTLKCYFSHFDGYHHVTVEKGDLTGSLINPVLTRLHSECFTGDVLGSQNCDCGEQLYKSLDAITTVGRGLLIYNAGHEGRGIGLVNKILAYNIQQTRGVDTYTANQELGFPADLRNYETAREIIKFLGIEKINLITANSTKILYFQDIVSSVHTIQGVWNVHNSAYLEAKKKYNEFISQMSSSTDSLDSSLQFLDFKNITNEQNVLYKVHDPPKSLLAILDERNILGELKIGFIHTMWNDGIIGPFGLAIYEKLLYYKIQPDNINKVLVPGSFEIPWAAQMLTQTCDAVICIGLLIKGETMQFEVVSQSVGQGLMNIQLDKNVPVINAVFNCLTMDQGKARCGIDSPLAASLAATTIHMAKLKKARKPPILS